MIKNPLIIQQAQALLKDADTVLIYAGAGMSADLGIPTYWEGDDIAYGAGLATDGITHLEHAMNGFVKQNQQQSAEYFQDMYASINSILESKKSEPTTYSLLLNWLERNNKDYFATTSNVDSAFVFFGFDSERLFEVHGAYRNSQCKRHGIFPTPDPTQSIALCPTCGKITRPNVILFDDFHFMKRIWKEQFERYRTARSNFFSQKIVALEIGVGITVPTIFNEVKDRYFERTPVIRINPAYLPESAYLLPTREEAQDFIWIEDTALSGLEKLLTN